MLARGGLSARSGTTKKMSIAAANYGTKAAWRLILDANTDKIPDKDRIKTGVVLKLPKDAVDPIDTIVELVLSS